MHCAGLLVCLSGWFFAFWHCICISLLALFFLVISCIGYLFILSNYSHLHWLFAFCRFLHMLPTRFDCLSALTICFFLRFRLQQLLLWVKGFASWRFCLPYPFHFGHFTRLMFNYLFAMVLHRFVIVCFAFFLHYHVYCCSLQLNIYAYAVTDTICLHFVPPNNPLWPP